MIIKKTLLFGTALTVAVTGILLLDRKEDRPSTETPAGASSVKQQPSKEKQAPTAIISPETFSTGVTPEEKTIFTSQQKETLANYALLKQKVFLKSDEQDTRTKLLTDRDFLSNLGPVLKVASDKTQQELGKLQNAAIDLLLEAQFEHQSVEATEVLTSIVQDNQIENISLPQDQRESLAGIKAEILYRWSAQDPNIVEKIPGLLPGPISQQIWNNVVLTQRNNHGESLAEVNNKQ